MSRHLTVAAAFVIALVVVAVPAWAFWTTTTTSAVSAIPASTLAAAATGSVTGATTSSLTINVLTAPASGPTPSSYRVDRTSVAAPGAALGVCTITGSTGNCTDSGLSAGIPYTYAVFSKVGTNWVSANSLAQSGATTGGGPTISFTFPSTGGFHDTTSWIAGCSTPAANDFCGTATAGTGTISTIRYSVRRLSDNLYTTAAPGGSFTSASEVLLTPTGTTSWSQAFNATSFATGIQYTIRAVVTNSGAATASASSTFTWDAGLPPPPTSVNLIGGVNNATRSGTTVTCNLTANGKVTTVNLTTADIDVLLGAGSRSTDTVSMTVTDGTTTLGPFTIAATAGASTVSFANVDVTSLDDGVLAIGYAVKIVARTGTSSTTVTRSITKNTDASIWLIDPTYSDKAGATADQIIGAKDGLDSDALIVATQTVGGTVGTKYGTTAGSPQSSFGLNVAAQTSGAYSYTVVATQPTTCNTESRVVSGTAAL